MAVLLTPSASKAADMAHLCVPQNQALGVCRGFVPDIQICSTHGRKDLVNATIISNAEEEEEGSCERRSELTEEIHIPLRPLPKDDALRRWRFYEWTTVRHWLAKVRGHLVGLALLYDFGSCERHSELTEEMHIPVRALPEDSLRSWGFYEWTTDKHW